MNYFEKMRGSGPSPPGVGAGEVFWSWLGSFLGISAVALLHAGLFEPRDLSLLIGSFGASAVLIYGAVRSPLAQPRNLAVAVSLAIAIMHLTRTLHPPGGATALIAVIGGDSVHQLGYLYVLVPAALGALVMLVIALLVNNIPKTRKYPEFWF